MESLAVITAAVLVLSLAVNNAAGLYCFQCNSHSDPDCHNVKANDTSSRFYKPCLQTEENEGKKLFCRKTVQIIMDREFLVRTIRSCGWVQHPKYECYYYRNKGHEDVSCQCFKDGCNSAHTSSASIFSIVGLAAAAVASKFL